MKSTIAIAAAAALPLATALQQSQSGGAQIVNYCNFDIQMQNVPAMKSGVVNGEITSKTLKANNVGPDSTYFTNWIALDPSVQGGWSMKLNTLGNWNDIMQSEYTWHGDGNVWYDMSFVNGIEANHPPWKFVSPGLSPAPHQGAYQYPSDDANGMQVPVAPSVTITLQLCPPSGGASTGASQAPSVTTTTTSSAPAAPPAPTTPSVAAPVPTTTSSSTTTTTTPTPTTTVATTTPSTTLSTAIITPAAKAVAAGIPADNNDPEIVTEYATVIVTVLATETASVHSRVRRHEHRHPHGGRH